MSNYFQDFPVVDYKFGDEVTTTQFQHLGTAVDILDQVKQFEVYYSTYHIRNGERPEQVSYKLYGDVNHYWTFYLLNDHLRQQGWPIRDADVYPKAQEYYPNTVLAVNGVAQTKEPKVVNNETIWFPTDEQIPMTNSTAFTAGNYLYFPNSGVAGKLLRVDQKMGMLWCEVNGLRTTVDILCVAIPESEGLKVIADPTYVPVTQYAEMEINKIWDEFDAPHHYEDVDGNWVWPSYSSTYPYPFNHSLSSTVQSVSFYERLTELNEDQKAISVIKADSIVTIVQEFGKLLRA